MPPTNILHENKILHMSQTTSLNQFLTRITSHFQNIHKNISHGVHTNDLVNVSEPNTANKQLLLKNKEFHLGQNDIHDAKQLNKMKTHENVSSLSVANLPEGEVIHELQKKSALRSKHPPHWREAFRDPLLRYFIVSKVCLDMQNVHKRLSNAARHSATNESQEQGGVNRLGGLNGHGGLHGLEKGATTQNINFPNSISIPHWKKMCSIQPVILYIWINKMKKCITQQFEEQLQILALLHKKRRLKKFFSASKLSSDFLSQKINYYTFSQSLRLKLLSLFHFIFIKLYPKLEYDKAIGLLQLYFVYILIPFVNKIESMKREVLKYQYKHFHSIAWKIENWIRNMIPMLHPPQLDESTEALFNLNCEIFDAYLNNVGAVHFHYYLKLATTTLQSSWPYIQDEIHAQSIFNLVKFWNITSACKTMNARLCMTCIWIARWIVSLRILHENSTIRSQILNILEEEYKWVYESVSINPFHMEHHVNRHIMKFASEFTSQIQPYIVASIIRELHALRYLKSTISSCYNDFESNIGTSELKDWIASFKTSTISRSMMQILRTTLKFYPIEGRHLQLHRKESESKAYLGESILKFQSSIETILLILSHLCQLLPKSHCIHLQLSSIVIHHNRGTKSLKKYLQAVMAYYGANPTIQDSEKLFFQTIFEALSSISRIPLTNSSFFKYCLSTSLSMSQQSKVEDLALSLNGFITATISGKLLQNVQNVPIVYPKSQSTPNILLRIAFDAIHFRKQQILVHTSSLNSENRQWKTTIESYHLSLQERIRTMFDEIKALEASSTPFSNMVDQMKSKWKEVSTIMKEISRKDENQRQLQIQATKFSNMFRGYEFQSQNHILSLKYKGHSNEKWIYNNEEDKWVQVDERFVDEIEWNDELNCYTFGESLHAIFQEGLLKHLNLQKEQRLHIFTSQYSNSFTVVWFCLFIPIDSSFLALR